MTSHEPLNDRSQHLLKVLVSEFIRRGLPVGSQKLLERSALELSPATIRNVMKELERGGFVESPHVSAGKVPTSQGYRFFVDSLVSESSAQADFVEQLKTHVHAGTATEAAQSASAAVSMLTNCVGIVTVPARNSFAFRHIDFVPLSDRQVLAVVIFEDGEVENRLLKPERGFSRSELEQAANFLNAEYAGRRLQEIRSQLIADMARARQQADELMAATLDVANRALQGQEAPTLLLSGQTRLMGYSELKDLDKLKLLFEAFQEKRELLHLLEECVSADGVRLFIGDENRNPALDKCSLVSAPYRIDESTVGVVGVIGPTRMAYDRVISAVQQTATALSRAIGHG